MCYSLTWQEESLFLNQCVLSWREGSSYFVWYSKSSLQNNTINYSSIIYELLGLSVAIYIYFNCCDDQQQEVSYQIF